MSCTELTPENKSNLFVVSGIGAEVRGRAQLASVSMTKELTGRIRRLVRRNCSQYPSLV
jgi:hypothetical protein